MNTQIQEQQCPKRSRLNAICIYSVGLEMIQAEVIDALNFSHGFPTPSVPEIGRDHILETIDRMFDNKVDVLLIDGEEGVGKTILLSQFVKRHRQNTVSLFLKPASRSAVEPAYIASILGEQLHWILRGETIEQDNVSDADLRAYFASLNRKLSRLKQVCFIVIDGLEDSALPPHVADIILSQLLPFGLPSYRYVVTGTLGRIGEHLHKSLVSRTFTVPLCSYDEALRYLEDLVTVAGDLEDLYRLCSKNFGRLATIRRLVQSGIDPDKLLNESPPDFMSLEWRTVEQGSTPVRDIVRALAFAQGAYDANALAQITGHTQVEILRALSTTTFIVKDNLSEELAFCSTAHRRYAQRKLEDEKDKILDTLISYHANSTHTPVLDSQLPHYLTAARRYGDLVAFLNTDHFLKLAQSTQSLTSIQSATTLGLNAAIALDNFGHMTRFAAQAGFLAELSTGETSRAEIDARVQLNDKQLALALSHRASLKETRLQLLAATASALKKYHNELDSDLMAQIKALIDQIDLPSMGQSAIDVASDLVTVDPDLALRIVQESSKNHAGESSVDTAFAKFALQTLSQRNDSQAARAATENAKSRVTDPSIQSFITTLSLFLGKASARDVVTHAESLDPTRALYFLRAWAMSTDAYDEAASVLDYGLDLLIRNSTYTPQIRDLRELATPLQYIPDNAALLRLISRFDSQRATVLNLGTNVDLIRLQLQLAAAEVRLDPNKAHLRLLELYWQVSEIQDLSTKATCQGWMVSQYRVIDPDNTLERQEGLLTVLGNELDASLRELLDTTAEHFDVAKGALRAFSRHNIGQALKLAAQLNTEFRRNQAYVEIVQYASRSKVTIENLADLFEAINRITNFNLRDSAIATLISTVCKSTRRFGEQHKATMAHIFELSKQISLSSLRARALADFYSYLRSDADNVDLSSLQSAILVEIDRAWQSVDSLWRKTTLCFQIAMEIGTRDLAVAEAYVKRAESIRGDSDLVAESQFELYSAYVRLTIRAFAGLLPLRFEDDGCTQALAKVIDIIPSRSERARLWAEVACRAYLVDRKDICEKIVAKHVRPLLTLIPDDNPSIRWDTYVSVAPALFVAHQTTALDILSKLPEMVREEAVYETCTFILRHAPIHDAYVERHSRPHAKFKYEDIISLFTLLMQITNDSAIYYVVKEITDYSNSRQAKTELTRQNIADIADRIEQDIVPRLPDLRNIKHEGFVIACLAQVARLRSYSLPNWEELIGRAKNIPNVADRSYVLLILAGGMASRFATRTQELFKEARTLIESIPAAIDRMDRLESMAEECREANPPLARECVRAAYTWACVDSKSEDLSSRRRALLDLAHSIDAKFAEELVGIIDDDLGRRTIKREAQERLKTLEIEKGLVDKEVDLAKLKKDRNELAQASWRGLGLLNAGWIDPVHIEKLRPYLEFCAELPLVESSYPILSWIIENLVQRVSKAPAARTVLIPLFNSLVQGAESAINIIGKTNEGQASTFKRFSLESDTNANESLVIAPGERDRGLQFISKWMAETGGPYLKVVDPYFGVEDLALVRLVRTANPQCKLTIVTSKAHQPRGMDLEEFYIQYWKNHISPHLPGGVDIIVAGTESTGELPIHDRWWIMQNGGLRLGTSFNSLGTSKSSDISFIHQDSIQDNESKIDAIIQRTQREHNGSRLSFAIIAL